MANGNLSAVLYGKGDLRLEDWPIPEPEAGEVQLCMQDVGICGSDVHFWTEGGIGDFMVKAPMVLGHEACGMVSKLGSGVTGLKVGDRVAIEPGVPCNVCKQCRHGRYNLCPYVKFCATPPVHGSLAQYYNHSANFCFKLPDHVTSEEGAMLEPLSVALHACKRGGVELGSRVLVCGAGPVGLIMMMTAKAKGASEVCITDIDQGRLDFAKKLGANYTLKVESRDAKEVARQIVELMGEPADITIECSGAPSSTRTALYATQSGGCVVMVGLGPTDQELPIVSASLREVDIKGNLRYANCYPTALSMVASGAVDLKPLVTHRFSLEKTLEAFEAARQGQGVKIMIHCAK